MTAFSRFDQELVRKHDRRVQATHGKLQELQMVAAFSQVAREHKMSAPLVAAFRATPGFDQAVTNFPDPALYNIVPEVATSARNVAGLESLDTAQTETVGSIAQYATQVATSFSDILANVGQVIPALQHQVENSKTALLASDVTDEVMSDLLVNSMANGPLTQSLNKLDEQLKTVKSFDTADLRAHPDRLGQEVSQLVDVVQDLSQTFGLGITSFGVAEQDRDDKYVASVGTFASKDINLSGMTFCLDMAASILDSLNSIATQQADLSGAIAQEALSIPETLTSTDVTYGCTEHVMLMTSYTTLTTKLLREAVSSVGQVLQTVDSVLNIQTGIEA